MVHAARFAELVRRLKVRDGRGAVRMAVETPGLIVPLARAAGERVGRHLFSTSDAKRYQCLELVSEAQQILVAPKFRRVTVPGAPSGWTAMRAAALAAEAGPGNARLRVHGRAGLDALGYVPGWAAAELVPPAEGWTQSEAARIAALAWPVTCAKERPIPDIVSAPRPAT